MHKIYSLNKRGVNNMDYIVLSKILICSLLENKNNNK